MTSNDTVRQLLTTVTNPQAPVVSIGSNLAHLRNIPAGILCHSEASPTNSTKCLIARPLSADESVLLSLIIFFQMGSNSWRGTLPSSHCGGCWQEFWKSAVCSNDYSNFKHTNCKFQTLQLRKTMQSLSAKATPPMTHVWVRGCGWLPDVVLLFASLQGPYWLASSPQSLSTQHEMALMAINNSERG